MDAVGLMEVGLATSYKKPPALGVVLVGSEVVASHPRARLEPSTFFPRVENPHLANELRSSANADDFTRIPKPVEAEVANLKFSGGTSRAGAIRTWNSATNVILVLGF